jgi:hypothetical protein
MKPVRMPFLVKGIAYALLLVCATAIAQETAAINVSGTWAIQSRGEEGKSAEQTVMLKQSGTALTGHFKGPHQSGGVSGEVTGDHVYFMTKTREVLHFRGVLENGEMHGTMEIRGKTGTWTATRSEPGAK